MANWQGKLHWRNKLWRIDYESLIKHILKQFEDTSVPNLSIRARVCARMAVSSLVWPDPLRAGTYRLEIISAVLHARLGCFVSSRIYD